MRIVAAVPRQGGRARSRLRTAEIVIMAATVALSAALFFLQRPFGR
jgi:hypothetical protein